MLALTFLLALLGSTPAVVAESFPDDDTSGWAVRTDVYGEAYDDGTRATLVDVYATPLAGPSEYALSVRPLSGGGLTACEGYERPRGSGGRWSLLWTDPRCE